MRRLSRALAFLVVAGCGDPEPRQVRLELSTRSSCGSSTLNYDVTCVRAMQVALVDMDRRPLKTRCSEIPAEVTNVNELATLPGLMPVLKKVKARKQVMVEFRAYHVFDKEPCTDLQPSELMLWGSSEPVDLTDEELQTIKVSVECRPRCDCADFDDSVDPCPQDLVAGVCTPPARVPCAHSCTDHEDCYGAALQCINRRCRPQDGLMCHQCDGPTECDSGLCVESGEIGDCFCAEPCPKEASSAPCPQFMSCKRLGDNWKLVDYQTVVGIDGR